MDLIEMIIEHHGYCVADDKEHSFLSWAGRMISELDYELYKNNPDLIAYAMTQ